MRTRTSHQITLSISELESLLSKMTEHKENNGTLGNTVTIDLDYDTDWQTLRFSDKVGNAYQHNSYAECNGHRFTE